MIKGIGVDIVKVERVKEELGKKVLTGHERYINSQHFAGLWAVKEAVLKAFGCGIAEISFKDIEITYDDKGAPKVELSQAAKKKMRNMGGSHVLVSISHEREYAVAFAVIE